MIEQLAKPGAVSARWYDIIAVESRSLPISFKNNRIYSIVERENAGVGVRVNVNGRTGFSHTNNLSRIQETMDAALALAGYGDEDDFALPEKNPEVRFEPFTDNAGSFSIEKELDAAEKTIARILNEFPGSQTDLNLGISSGKKRIMNSGGMDCSYRFSAYGVSLSTTCIFENGVRLSVSEGRSGLSPADYTDIAEKLLWKLRNAQRLGNARSGKVPLVLTPKAFSSLLGIVAAGLSARAVFKGISPFKDKLGMKIFNDRFTLLDDPLAPGSVYSYPFDDEGVQAYAKPVIEHGEIRTFITDLKYAGRLGIDPTGNASRGFSSMPSISFSSIAVEEGSAPAEEILKGMKYAVLADQFIGLGQSNTLTGDFSASLDLGFLVEGGEIAGRVKDCMVTANLFELLSGEMVMSSERELYGSSLVPWVFFPSVSFTS